MLHKCLPLNDLEISIEFNTAKHNREEFLNHLQTDNPLLYQLCLISKQYKQGEVEPSYVLGAQVIYSLLEEAAKPNRLPVVSEDTLHSSVASFFDGNSKENGVGVCTTMYKEDETLLSCAAYIIDNSDYTVEEQDFMCKGMNQFYYLLRRQAEADDMKGWLE